MKEGSVVPNINRVPNISLDESIKMEMQAMKLVMEVPGVKSAVSGVGRGESPADPAGPERVDAHRQPQAARRVAGRLDAGHIADAMREKLKVLPGVQVVMAQPISDRVDEMVTGVRSDVAVKVFGDDLDLLREKADEIARVARRRGRGHRHPRRAHHRPAVPVGRDRPRAHRPPRPQRVGRERRDRGGHRRQAGHRGLRGRTPLPSVVRLPESFRDNVEKIGNMLVNARRRRAGGAGKPGQHPHRRRPGADLPRARQAPHRGGDQREGPRPGRLRGRAAEDRSPR
jgi:cobalt-zinc-cadmium resistance protein CzcA